MNRGKQLESMRAWIAFFLFSVIIPIIMRSEAAWKVVHGVHRQSKVREKEV